ncbi:MAG: hypothetical protein SCJ94_06825 [Bacillota bacterium]|nr:hypothetical protein [Bacillota bacterium]
MSGNLIEIKLPKGCRLFLTPEEYSRGLTRGKSIRRRRSFQKRTQEVIETAQERLSEIKQ